MLARADLRAAEEALRRWLAAAALARPADEGGRVVAVGDPAQPGAAGAGALGPGRVRRAASWPSGSRAHLPPASRLATLTGSPSRRSTAALAALRPAGRRRGARPGARRRRAGTDRRPRRAAVRAVLRVPRAAGPALSRALVRDAGRRGRRRSCRRCGSRSTRSTRLTAARRLRRLAARRRPSASHARSTAVAVQPIRLFGDPVLRTPAAPVVDFDKELRRLVAGPHRHDARRARRRPGRAADRRRAAGVHLVRRRRARPPGQPDADLSEEQQDGEEGCLSIPGLTFDCTRALSGGRDGLRHARRAGHHRGQRPAGPGHPARDRPPRRHPVRRPARPRARKAAMKAIREAEWFGGPRADGQGLARTRRTGSASDACVVFAGTPEVALPALRRDRGQPARAGRRGHPPRRARRPRPQAGRRRRSPSAPRSSASRCSSRRTRATRTSRPAARARARLLPGRRLRRAAAAERAGHPARTAGSTCTSRCCPPGAAPRRCSTPSVAGDEVTGATTFRIVAGARRRPDARRDDRAGPARRHRRRPAASGSPRRGAGLLVATLDGIEDGTLEARAQPADGVSLAPKITVEDARVDWAEPGRRGRPAGPGLHAGAGRLDDVRRGADQARPGAAVDRTREPLAPGRARGRPRTRCTSAPAPHPVRLGEVQAARQEGRWPPADWARGVRGRARRACGSTLSDPAHAPGGRRPRAPPADPAREAAFDVLRRSASEDAYANLVLPPPAARARARPAATPRSPPSSSSGTLAAAGHLRRDPRRLRRPAAGQGRRRRCSTRCGSAPTSCSRMRVPAHAAVGTTVDLVRATVGHGPAGFVNAVLRRVADARPGRVGAPGRARPGADPVGFASVAHSHPRWVVEALRRGARRPADELDGAAGRRQRAAEVTLVARPGLATVDELVAAGGAGAGAVAVRRACCAGGDPGGDPGGARGPGRRAGRGLPAGRARARRRAAVDGRDERWLDLCAGPGRQGGAARGAGRPARRPAARRRSGSRTGPRWCASATSRAGATGCSAWSPPTAPGPAWRAGGVRPGAGRRAVHRARRAAPPAGGPLAAHPGGPRRRSCRCSARCSARRWTRCGPGGVVAYVTCSPVLAETAGVVAAVLAEPRRRRLEDARAAAPTADRRRPARCRAPSSCGRTGTAPTRCSSALLRRS